MVNLLLNHFLIGRNGFCQKAKDAAVGEALASYRQLSIPYSVVRCSVPVGFLERRVGRNLEQRLFAFFSTSSFKQLHKKTIKYASSNRETQNTSCIYILIKQSLSVCLSVTTPPRFLIKTPWCHIFLWPSGTGEQNDQLSFWKSGKKNFRKFFALRPRPLWGPIPVRVS